MITDHNTIKMSNSPSYANNSPFTQSPTPLWNRSNYTEDRLTFTKTDKPNLLFGAAASYIDTAKILTPKGNYIDLKKRPDGGFNVDRTTGTILYYGNDAKKFLKNKKYFDRDTEIITQAHSKIVVRSEKGDVFCINEPGTIMINKDTKASVELAEGTILVITSQKTPRWYNKVSAHPKNKHASFFNEIVNLNRHIYENKEINKKALTETEYKTLLKNNIIEENARNEITSQNSNSISKIKKLFNTISLIFNKLLGNNPNHFFKFSNIKNITDFNEKIDNIGLTEKEKKKLTALYLRMQNAWNNPCQNPGEVKPSDFGSNRQLFTKLLLCGILKKSSSDISVTWGEIL